MWRYELALNAGSAESPSSSNYLTCRLIATFTYVGAVSTRLSLPWSLFEHMAGNWLASNPDPILPVRMIELARQAIGPRDLHLAETILPATTNRELLAVLDAGRLVVELVTKAVHETPGVREVLEGEGFRVLIPDAVAAL